MTTDTAALEQLIATQHYMLKPAGSKGRQYNLPDDRLAAVCRELVEALPNITYQSSVKRREEMLHDVLTRTNAIALGKQQTQGGRG